MTPLKEISLVSAGITPSLFGVKDEVFMTGMMHMFLSILSISAHILFLSLSLSLPLLKFKTGWFPDVCRFIMMFSFTDISYVHQ